MGEVTFPLRDHIHPYQPATALQQWQLLLSHSQDMALPWSYTNGASLVPSCSQLACWSKHWGRNSSQTGRNLMQLCCFQQVRTKGWSYSSMIFLEDRGSHEKQLLHTSAARRRQQSFQPGFLLSSLPTQPGSNLEQGLHLANTSQPLQHI